MSLGEVARAWNQLQEEIGKIVLSGYLPGRPPPATREAGKTYNTPRGKMKWTGTGWG